MAENSLGSLDVYVGGRVKPERPSQGLSNIAARDDGGPQPARLDDLWRRVFSKQNLERALEQVERNKGAPGPDGMTVKDLRPWLRAHWPEVRVALNDGTYKPQPVRRVLIPKSGGGQRGLGVPNVLDRMICQAIAQVLADVFDPGFSEFSFGFREGRSAHQAVLAAKGYVAQGYEWGVALDLDLFFDRVQHDVLMNRVARRVSDKALLRLIGSYLRAGFMDGGVRRPSEVGTPQGSPLSPILSNILLDDLDKELEARGHRFVRYADDVHIYMRSKRAGERVKESIAGFIDKKLKLKVNQSKSKVAKAGKVTLLGFRIQKSGSKVRIYVAPESKERLRDKIRALTSRTRGVSIYKRIREVNRLVPGWTAYFALADTPSIFTNLDGWMRRRFRQVLWRDWKNGRNRFRNLVRLGVSRQDAKSVAGSSKSSWRLAHTTPVEQALSNQYWHRDMDLASFQSQYGRSGYALRTA